MIVAAIDWTEIADTVIETAAELAAATGSELLLLHVAAPDPDFVGYEAGPGTVRDARAGELREEHRRLQEEALRLRERGVLARALLVEGPTAETVLAEAAKHDTRFIVVGSHGGGLVRRAFLGSVSQAVAREAPCPVVIVPPRAVE